MLKTEECAPDLLEHFMVPEKGEGILTRGSTCCIIWNFQFKFENHITN